MFPEGGNLIDGVNAVVAFKATYGNELPEEVSGKVMEDGHEIAAIHSIHDGMGLFALCPYNGKNYKVVLSDGRSWLKKRLNLTLSATNFLKKYTCFNTSMDDSFFHSDNWSKSVVQRFSLSISYRIGELKASVRKAERTISNDDVKGGGNSGGESGGTSE